MEIKQLDNKYIANTYHRADLLLEKGKGSLLYDEKGKEYIDLGSGIAVNIFGIADEEWENAVSHQLKQIQHASNYYYTQPQAKLAELLCKKTGMKKVFFGNSGAEANEAAIKAARKYGSDKYGKDRNIIITLVNSFHGRTIATLAATGQDDFHHDFGPFPEGFVYADANDSEALVKIVDENDGKICAIMFELIQGEGGVNVLSEQFTKTIADICSKKDILMVCDEVQTGNGRTGKLYCYMNYGLKPDIFTTAKGLGGGLPISATVFGEKTENVLTAGTHGSTFGGNPVCAAGAFSILSRLNEDVFEGVKLRSNYIIDELSPLDTVESVDGLGLMLGIKPKKDLSKVVEACKEKGVIVLTAKDKLRLLPALNIPMEQLKKAIEIIKEALI